MILGVYSQLFKRLKETITGAFRVSRVFFRNSLLTTPVRSIINGEAASNEKILSKKGGQK